MKILGLDIGNRRIGVAFIDTEVGVISPLSTLANNRSLVNEIKKLIHQYQFETMVVGLPITLAGHQGEQAKHVMMTAKQLQAKLGLKLVFEDERMTSQTAAQRLRLTDHTKGDIDAVSAMIILENWMARTE